MNIKSGMSYLFFLAFSRNSLTEKVSFVPENRTFAFHITLARISSWGFRAIEPEERPEINESLDLAFSVESIEVMESEMKRNGPVYTILESAVMASLGLAYFYLTPFAWFPSLVMLFFSLEGLLFLFVCHKNLFRIGITSKAILVADREVILIYLSGLRQVSISQQTVYFDYLENLQLTFPTDCVEENEREQFFNTLKEQVNRDKVLFKNVD